MNDHLLLHDKQNRDIVKNAYNSCEMQAGSGLKNF
jgi:hypothetical protein